MGNNITPKVGVGAVIIKNDVTLGPMILLGKRLSKIGHGEWGLPGGHVEMMEDPEHACIRETWEETGLRIQGLNPLYEYPYSNDIFKESGEHYITLFFVPEMVNGVLINREPEKCENWEWFNRETMPKELFPPLKEMFQKGILF